MKRILIFSLAYYPKFVGGAEVAIKETTDRINQNEAEFDMITLRFDSSLPKFEKIGNVNVYRIGFSKRNPIPAELISFPLYLVKVLYPIQAFFKAWQLHKKRKYDAMWSMMSYMGFPALFMKWVFPNLEFLLTLQEGDKLEDVVGRKRIQMVGWFYRQIFKKADKVQAISNYLADFARQMGAEAEVSVIPNGVNIEKFEIRNLKFEKEEFRSKLGFTATDIILITTSRLVPKNAVGDIVDSLVFLPSNIKLLIAGSGPLESSLKEKVKNQKLEGRVQFLGFVSQESLPEYLWAGDIFIRPSLSEGQGISFIEAMAAGIPVITTPVGGIPDFIFDGETGLFCEVENPESIAQKVEELIENPSLSQKIATNALRLVKDKYNWSNIANDMKKFFGIVS